MTGNAWDFAVCAPGCKPLAALTLMLSGEQAGEIREHPWLKPGQVILMRDPEEIDPPFPLHGDKAWNVAPEYPFPLFPPSAAPIPPSAITGLT